VQHEGSNTDKTDRRIVCWHHQRVKKRLINTFISRQQNITASLIHTTHSTTVSHTRKDTIMTDNSYYYYYYDRPMARIDNRNKSSAVAEMGDRGHNRHGPKRVGGAVPLSRSAGNPSNTMWPVRGLLPYQVASPSIQPFGHNSVGCHWLHRNISTN